MFNWTPRQHRTPLLSDLVSGKMLTTDVRLSSVAKFSGWSCCIFEVFFFFFFTAVKENLKRIPAER